MIGRCGKKPYQTLPFIGKVNYLNDELLPIRDPATTLSHSIALNATETSMGKRKFKFISKASERPPTGTRNQQS